MSRGLLDVLLVKLATSTVVSSSSSTASGWLDKGAWLHGRRPGAAGSQPAAVREHGARREQQGRGSSSSFKQRSSNSVDRRSSRGVGKEEQQQTKDEGRQQGHSRAEVQPPI